MWKRIGIGVGVFLMLVSTVVVVAYKHLEGNISVITDPGNLNKDRPVEEVPKALNVLVMGSDTRQGANGVGIGGQTPGLSDTTILLHLSANRKFAYGVSLPRDAMVERPACYKKGGHGIDPGGLTQFNAAYAIGGPTCTVKTVEQLTGVRIDHYVVVDFVGFKNMVNAIGGVTICVPKAVNDTVGNINLPAGTYKVTGQQALDYVRVRHDIGAPTGDIGRMKRQQSFISAMIKKAVSAGTLTNPVRLYNFLNAATKSLSTDPGFASLKALSSLGKSLKGIGLNHVQFVTVPWEPWTQDPNRVQWKPEAKSLWYLIKKDRPLGSFGDDAISPGSGESPSSTPSGSPTGTPSGSNSPSGTGSPSSHPTKSQAERDAEAQAAGLCT
ncbi:LCP family protein [Nocardioides marmorisolisilvae]|uniref:LytR family transcriptional regulator n=1 Tax=Nocardioides marmorisolisilvae TaxID=1542737 RepID=A0A3N0DRL3_9ACTN|nr:LCP family protein [Nocardioides marmorisolisilvae]RNL78279.1 LytR family transcriptional regulator [Nocardioides marmorisolisilvae]